MRGAQATDAVEETAAPATPPPSMRWFDVEVDGLPRTAGEYLCFVRVPQSRHGRRCRPSHHRYMTLEFVNGTFWVRNGAPTGMVLAWAYLSPPSWCEARYGGDLRLRQPALREEEPRGLSPSVRANRKVP